MHQAAHPKKIISAKHYWCSLWNVLLAGWWFFGAKWVIQNGINKEQKWDSAKKQWACFNNARIETYKILIILNSAWEKSFAWTDFNKEAIAARWWCPLIWNAETASRQKILIWCFVPKLLQWPGKHGHGSYFTKHWQKTVHQQIRNNQHEGEQALANFVNHKKLSTGVVFKAEKALLGPDVLAAQLEWKRIREQREQEQQVNDNEATAALIALMGGDKDADVIEDVVVWGKKKERNVQQQ